MRLLHVPVLIKPLLLVVACLLGSAALAQYRIQGTVFDSSRSVPLEAVSVISTSGAGTVTDANGRYNIAVGEKDSIWFSYLGKPTMKFPVLGINDINQFNIALQVRVTVMRDLRIRPRNYREDSLQNREDYAKAFNFQRPNLGTMTSIGPTGAGIDINELIRVFQFRKNKSMERFQARLLLQEQDKYIDYRFNKALVRRLTNLTGEDLDAFMKAHRPTYEFTVYSNDYDFQAYIKEAHRMWSRSKGF
ncbi:CarboxypepD_reg-like domain-containing protein [Cnuella takakiae]|uniref:CarboxypepD_reg-like domain-containing protein n=1 Tax=Cnuella takakiae TaxID=1302690 RepID=A0A1M5FCA4_9BACT|nr:carboxypeptidase-like regulatory domain-containing protein [Cnuella takakiae]OLY91041.1 hypothetical protein BUE76_03350 [Cnuella takakiae]SHF88671.1 CarboxypepD_reg-like domain-containing protein [Cnuella takakiae]